MKALSKNKNLYSYLMYNETRTLKVSIVKAGKNVPYTNVAEQKFLIVNVAKTTNGLALYKLSSFAKEGDSSTHAFIAMTLDLISILLEARRKQDGCGFLSF